MVEPDGKGFNNFVSDMGPRPAGKKEGNYEPAKRRYRNGLKTPASLEKLSDIV
jgi:hypothetical protein